MVSKAPFYFHPSSFHPTPYRVLLSQCSILGDIFIHSRGEGKRDENYRLQKERILERAIERISYPLHNKPNDDTVPMLDFFRWGGGRRNDVTPGAEHG